MFGFFKKKDKLVLPERYKNFINLDEYAEIISICKQYHEEMGIAIQKIDEGEIVVDANGEKQSKFLDNLVRLLSGNDKEAWKGLIYTHFDKLKSNPAAFKYIFKDFDFATPLLRVLVKDIGMANEMDLGEFVQRQDFPKTITFLVVEFEDKFAYVRHDQILEWEKKEKELFEIAISNTSFEEVDVIEYLLSDKYPLFTILSGDFSAAMMLNPKFWQEYGLGKFGALVSIPSKGSAFVHPIETPDVLNVLAELSPMVYKFFEEDPGHITPLFYWHYQGEFELFPIKQKDDGAYVELPTKLKHLFNMQD